MFSSDLMSSECPSDLVLSLSAAVTASVQPFTPYNARVQHRMLCRPTIGRSFGYVLLLSEIHYISLYFTYLLTVLLHQCFIQCSRCCPMQDTLMSE